MKIIIAPASAEIVEKKSRFIADASPVANESEAAGFIAAVKKKYWDCKHHCTAFVIGERGELSRCTDDGEPAGTAGRPILELIQSCGLTDICVVVSRYFGGTLLGTGGLVRAYSSAAKAAIQAAQPAEKHKGIITRVIAGYELIDKIRRAAAISGAAELSCEYSEEIIMEYICETGSEQTLADALVNATAARIKTEKAGEAYYIIAGNKVRLL